jgi:photoactive yellow protein
MISISFEDSNILRRLDAADDVVLDSVPFGVIRINGDGFVVSYNAVESESAGLCSERVLGRRFFSQVAPCMNNGLVAARFELEPQLDCVIDYVFALRLRSTPVRLRLLKSPGCRYRYLLVERVR